MQNLSNENINHAIEELRTVYEKCQVDRRDITTNLLVAEEVLLNYQEHFGEDTRFSIENKVFMGRVTTLLHIEGPEWDFFSSDSLEYDNTALMRRIGVTPLWKYGKGVNTLILSLRKKSLPEIFKTVIGLVLGLLLGVICRFLPEHAASVIVDELFSKLCASFAGMITAVAGPIIFLSLINSIINMETLTNLKANMKNIVGKMMLYSLLFYSIVLIPVVHMLNITSTGQSDSVLTIIVDTLLGIIPKNLFAPFIDGNVLQLLFISILLGVAILALSGTGTTRKAMAELNDITSYMMTAITTLLPIYIFMSITRFIYKLDTESSIIWKILVGYFIVVLIYFIISEIVRFLVTRRNPIEFYRGSMPTVLKACLSCSSVAVIKESMKTLTKTYKVDKTFVEFSVPIIQTLYKNAAMNEHISLFLILSIVNHYEFTISKLIISILVIFLFSISTPPVAGGCVAIITLICGLLGFDPSLIPIMITLDMFFDFCNSGIQAMDVQRMALILNGRSSESPKGK